jgi:hypothetical protein
MFPSQQSALPVQMAPFGWHVTHVPPLHWREQQSAPDVHALP